MRDARRWGLPETEIEALRVVLGGSRSEAGFSGVWPQNRETVDAFVGGASQWRTALAFEAGRPRTLWIGLDYAGMAVALSARGLALSAGLLSGIQVMEMGARDALNASHRGA
ncbi:DUF1799 domain-containing protein [Chelativorans alearense]|uniref:DUF1799 domain-containing protein n=1 Tax=Chelativorans alearense TaxID=2681495 RepID=UPI0013D3828D|nr:DUF1799 domain-containing protein [Chelativorans alearense]